MKNIQYEHSNIGYQLDSQSEQVTTETAEDYTNEQSISDNYEYLNNIEPASSVQENTSIHTAQTNRSELPTKSVFSSDDIARQLSQSSFGYSVPQEANINDDIEVVVKINPSISIDQLKEHLPEGQQITQNIQISRIVEVRLEARDFDVINLTPQRQIIMGDQDTTWKWSLKPLSSGPGKEVKITVTAIITVDGEKAERYLDTYVGKVNVNITTKQRITKWLSANWEWAWGSLLIPIVGFAWAKYSKKKKKKK
ncbi:MAG: hypothetical protein M0R77_20605 [Gammaproteobacteria bacterium]|nr:hypothetical protein [Gammaproteobacteria bacterium]